MYLPRQTRTALITGGSSGLGAQFAEQLAQRGYDLVLVARSFSRLQRVAERVRTAHGVRVDVITQDLTAPDAADHISAWLASHGRTVDLLANNAGFGTAGRFEQIPPGQDHDQLMVNVVALTSLTRALVPGMLDRGDGAIINVGSAAGFQPAPYFAAYSAAKTYVLNFSLALRAEYRHRGLRVLALMPGPTDTAFFNTIGTRAAIGGRMMTPDTVVRAALRALDRDRAYVVPGLSNQIGAHLTPRRPRRLVTAISERVTRHVLDASTPTSAPETDRHGSAGTPTPSNDASQLWAASQLAHQPGLPIPPDLAQLVCLPHGGRPQLRNTPGQRSGLRLREPTPGRVGPHSSRGARRTARTSLPNGRPAAGTNSRTSGARRRAPGLHARGDRRAVIGRAAQQLLRPADPPVDLLAGR